MKTDIMEIVLWNFDFYNKNYLSYFLSWDVVISVLQCVANFEADSIILTLSKGSNNVIRVESDLLLWV